MKALAKAYMVFIWLGKIIQPFLLLALRLFFGWQFFEGGLSKLGNMNQLVELFTAQGIPHALYAAHAVAWIETLGGIFLFLGLLTRVVAIPLSIILIGALATVHLKASQAILSDPAGFLSQTPVPFLIATLVLLAFGPGLFSFDALFKRALTGEEVKK